ncbi:Crp/Fnr family transcriptional regulator [Sphingobacterium oryzagri]|uniref:Crp/Fnr family transcriptional regulator n=1 Tax=Sphingobacterium oryzagri TaxID=3025669 RepID=A0ABY7WL00_9SPHI|nr:Crp/Fnr family transcriptional regulator [Sphingobacterium sp. KACC 22765]WDF70276.1 Crp/Fnr family transcriptional regulator [Sphingobacterium sp. KACC 22765]
MYPEKLRFIYQYPSMSHEDLDQIVAQHEKVVFKKGELLLREGQVSDCYYILEEGIVRSFVYDYDGNDISTNFFCTDDLVIEVASIFHHIPTKENFCCLTDCTLWRIKFDDFQGLFETIPAITEWGRAWMAHQLFLTKKRTLDMVSLAAIVRYQQLLEEKPQILQQAPLKYIATYLGITDTSLSRIRKELVGK